MSAARTSSSHPLRIDFVEYPGGTGRIGMTLCPGKQQTDSISGGAWARNLDADLDVICDWPAMSLLTFNEAWELDKLKVPELGERAIAYGLQWHHLPIPDGGVPGSDTWAQWQQLAPKLHDQLAAGESIVLHCMGGLGRTGSMAACLLMDTGVPVDEAIARVRQARPRAIETTAQEKWLRQRWETRHDA